MAHDLLVYDGDCGFCTRSARWAAAELPPGARVQPWQALDLDELGLTHHDVTNSAHWFDAEGRRHSASKAISHVLSASRGYRRVLGWFLRIPPFAWLAIPAYRLVARFRDQLPGSTCLVPQDERGS